jgi:hypothetical protein
VNKCDWNTHFALFSQFVTCLGRFVHHSPSQPTPFSSPTLLTLHLAHRPTTEGAKTIHHWYRNLQRRGVALIATAVPRRIG